MKAEEIVTRIILCLISVYLFWCVALWTWIPLTNLFETLGNLSITERAILIIGAGLFCKQENYYEPK